MILKWTYDVILVTARRDSLENVSNDIRTHGDNA